MTDQIQMPKQYRTMTMTAKKRVAEMPEGTPEEGGESPAEDQAEIYDIAISSEYPVERWFGSEILLHEKSAIDSTYLDAGAAILVNHDPDKQVGVLENWRLDKDRVMRGQIRFGPSEFAQEIEDDVEAEIRRFISVGYIPLEAELTKTQKNGPDEYTITRWMPMEVSIVAVPADPTVGVGRSAGDDATYPVNLIVRSSTTQADMQAAKQRRSKMDDDIQNQTTAPVNVQVTDNAAQRAGDIAELCASYGMPDKTVEYIRSNMSVDQVARKILEQRKSAPLPATGTEGFDIGNDKQRKQYSYARAIMGSALAAEGQGTFGGYEAEVSAEIERHLPSNYKRQGGIFVPISLRTSMDSMMQRAGLSTALDSQTTNKGKESVFTEFLEFVDLLRNMTRVVQMGARVITGLQGPATFVKQTGSGTAYWVAENSGSDVTSSNATFGTMTIAPKTLQSDTAFSRQLLVQSVVDIENIVRQDIALNHALAWDLSAIHGSGSGNEPTGLYSAAGVNSVAMGGVPTYGKLVDMTTEIALDNALMGNLGWLSTAGMAGKLMQTLVASAAGSDMIWKGNQIDGQVVGYKAAATNQVKSTLGGGNDEHGVLFGDWSQLIIGQWLAMELVVDPFRLKKQGLIEVTSIQMVDIGCRQPQSFVKATGAKIA